jgi:hypothetical protein
MQYQTHDDDVAMCGTVERSLQSLSSYYGLQINLIRYSLLSQYGDTILVHLYSLAGRLRRHFMFDAYRPSC